MQIVRAAVTGFAIAFLTVTVVDAQTTVHRSSLAQAGGAQIQLEVETACRDGVAQFKIINAGDAWPRAGTLNVLRITASGAETLTRRQMRFAAGQKASFRLKNPGNDTLGIFVQPSWYERAPQLDAQVSC